MVVLNIYGKIEPICISQKLKLYISNLPEEKHNEWNTELFEHFKETIEITKTIQVRLSLKSSISIKELHKQRCLCSSLSSTATDDEYLHEIVDNMICIHLDYSYDDMPLGGWESNPFDGRLCEKDYAELFVDFFHFICTTDADNAPLWIYSSNYDREIPYYRMFFTNIDLLSGIDTLKKWGQRIDDFLSAKNDYWQLDYIIRSIHEDNGYNTYHLFKLFSLCQMYLENKEERELDYKLPRFIDDSYTNDKKNKIAKILRQMRNKIAHGDFVGFEKTAEEYAKAVMDGQFAFDYSEYSRKNWTIINSCCLLEVAVKKMTYMLFTNKDELRKIKKSIL